MLEAGRCLWRSTCPRPLFRQGHLKLVTLHHVQTLFQCLQGWKLHSLPEQSSQSSVTLTIKKCPHPLDMVIQPLFNPSHCPLTQTLLPARSLPRFLLAFHLLPKYSSPFNLSHTYQTQFQLGFGFCLTSWPAASTVPWSLQPRQPLALTHPNKPLFVGGCRVQWSPSVQGAPGFLVLCHTVLPAHGTGLGIPQGDQGTSISSLQWGLYPSTAAVPGHGSHLPTPL